MTRRALRASACLLLFAAALRAADPPWPTHGWTTSTPEEQGMDSTRLAQADQWIRANSPNRFSLLVIRHGRMVFERYYNGRTAISKDHVASISKSFLSALTGIAIDQRLMTLDDRWFDSFPEYLPVPADLRTTQLKLRDMLTMSQGLGWTDLYIVAWMADFSGRTYPDWTRFTLSQPFENPPGTAFLYSTGNTHMLSAWLTRRSGMSTADYAVSNLFGPLGIVDFDWWREYNPPNYYTGGWGMVLRPADTAKLGYLYLHDGTWDGRQVVSADWVRASTRPQIRTGPGPSDFYGYLWWMDNFHGFFVPSARGLGSQFIWYSKELDLVAVSTADIVNDQGDVSKVMNDYVIPSVFGAAPAINAAGVVNAASNAGGVAPDSFVSIYGVNLAPAPVLWDSVVLDGKTLPATLGGVSVRVGGRDCSVSYAGPAQVNAVLPPDVPAGQVDVEVTHPGGTSHATITISPVAPALFRHPVGGKDYASAVFAGEAVVVGEGRVARPHDHIELYGTGLGATAAAHPVGQVLTQPYPIANPSSVQVLFGTVEAKVEAVNLTYAGVWQVNVEVPAGVSGDVPVTVRSGSAVSDSVLVQVQ